MTQGQRAWDHQGGSPSLRTRFRKRGPPAAVDTIRIGASPPGRPSRRAWIVPSAGGLVGGTPSAGRTRGRSALRHRCPTFARAVSITRPRPLRSRTWMPVWRRCKRRYAAKLIAWHEGQGKFQRRLDTAGRQEIAPTLDHGTNHGNACRVFLHISLSKDFDIFHDLRSS
jgi:hypothetical protein